MAQQLKNRRRRHLIYALLSFCLLGITLGTVACNDYPLQRLTAQTFTEVTDTLRQNNASKVDILFVIDNSGSMREEQEKLRANFESFIKSLISREVNDFQIGIITTDMDNPNQSGKLQAKSGQPKIVNSGQTRQAIVKAFTENSNLGIDGSPYEKGLAAMKAALSPPLSTGFNKGFLRPGALLAVIFVGDEDDCSHPPNSIPEGEYVSEVCYRPNSVILRDQQGNPLLDSNNKPIRGQMEKLISTKDYITFLKSLNREVIVSGLIGDPEVLVKDPADPSKTRRIDPQGCNVNASCTKGKEEHFCGYLNSRGERRCGGCKSKDANADTPGFRFFDLITAFSSGDASNLWFPICGDNNKFREALLRFAGLIIDKLNFVVLSKAPQVNPATKRPYIQVYIVQPNGQRILVPFAKKDNNKTCSKDSSCGGDFVCGSDSKCYGDGWVYFAPVTGTQAKLKLSGQAKRDSVPGSRTEVSYAASAVSPAANPNPNP